MTPKDLGANKPKLKEKGNSSISYQIHNSDTIKWLSKETGQKDTGTIDVNNCIVPKGKYLYNA